MGMHVGKEARERLLGSLEEAMLALRVVRKSAGVDEGWEGGWLRAVRLAVGTPVEEVARRQGVQVSEIYRLERAEKDSRITLGALRRVAEAMDCELTYGLTPKRGTLGEMAAVRGAVREKALVKMRAETNERRMAAGKPRRGRDPQLASIRELLRMATGDEGLRD